MNPIEHTTVLVDAAIWGAIGGFVAAMLREWRSRR